MTPDQKTKHLVFLRKHFVPAFPLPIGKFDKDQLTMLLKFGSWYEALEKGQIEAATEKQKDFQKHLREGYPMTTHEILWMDYKRLAQNARKKQGMTNSLGATWDSSKFDEIVGAQKASREAEPLQKSQSSGDGEVYVDPLAID